MEITTNAAVLGVADIQAKDMVYNVLYTITRGSKAHIGANVLRVSHKRTIVLLEGQDMYCVDTHQDESTLVAPLPKGFSITLTQE